MKWSTSQVGFKAEERPGTGDRVIRLARILVVDDDDLIQELYASFLPIGGHEVADVAFNGQEAVAKYGQMHPRPEVVIMDQRMPVKSGIEATREILAFDSTARILMISADQSVKALAVAAGAAGFLEKPFFLPRLLEAIKNVASNFTG
jgi:two-component system chemotaxis response regulator CheY